MSKKIAITGITGNIGGLVLPGFLKGGARIPIILLWVLSVCFTAPSTLLGKDADTVALNRDRAWLVGYLTQPIPAGPRTAQYLALINKELTNYCNASSDFSSGFEKAPSRYVSERLGRLAFAYHTPELNYYKDPKALAIVKDALLKAATYINSEGKFTFEDEFYNLGMHEHAWRLEPLLLGYIWVKDDLDDASSKIIEAALFRSAKYLSINKNLEKNNRGIVWSTITLLAAIYFEQQPWKDDVAKYSEGIFSAVVRDDGEIREDYAGGGPDGNYTYVSWAYIFQYYLYSGLNMPDRFLRGAQWLTLYNTRSGYPVVDGASVRSAQPNSPRFKDVLEFNEHYSKQYPYFGAINDLALKRIVDLGHHAYGDRSNGLSSFIWALLEGGTPAPPSTSTPPLWHLNNHTGEYSRHAVHYTLVSRRYSTGVVYRARKGPYRNIPAEGLPYRGMQTWAWGDERPIILHASLEARSYVEGGGVNSSLTDISNVDGKHEIKMETKPGPNSMDLATTLSRRGGLWSLYAYTPNSTLAIYGTTSGSIKAHWYTSSAAGSGPQHNSGARRFDYTGKSGKLYYLTGSGSASGNAADSNMAADISVDKGPLICAFSNEDFTFGTLDNNILKFKDGSGSYLLDLNEVISGGNINRNKPFRLTLVDSSSKIQPLIPASVFAKSDIKIAPFKRGIIVTVGNVGSDSKIMIFNSSGRMIKAIPVNVAGTAVWDGSGDNGKAVSNGFYAVKIANGKENITRGINLFNDTFEDQVFKCKNGLL